MPEVSRFLGILIFLYYKDHPPPHFHARYGKHEAQIDIRTLEVIAGSLPRPQLAFVITWGFLRQRALMNAWTAASQDKHPGRIAPLEGKSAKGKKGKKK